MFVVETWRKVLLFIVVPAREACSAAWRTPFGFLTMFWVTPGDAKRKLVGVERFSSVNVAATDAPLILVKGSSRW
ncbi:MAG TPA: hypothetical protein VHW04_03460 [Solirubrobacteraceae bacterium]|nr:hypothetical protein [Solirubrobacteraceae bacterium]